MSVGIRRILETSERELETLERVVLATAALNDIVTYTIHTHRRVDAFVGWRSLRNKLTSRTPDETFQDKVTTLSVVKVYVDLPARLYRNNIYMTYPHYFYKVTCERIPVAVSVLSSGSKKFFVVKDSEGDVLVADSIPPRSILGWVVTASLSDHPLFGLQLSPDDASSVYMLAKSKIVGYFSKRKLYGSVVEVRSGDCSVADIALRSGQIHLSDLVPPRETIQLEGTDAVVERATRVIVGKEVLFNPSSNVLARLSRQLDPVRARELERAVYEAIMGVSIFVTEKIIDS